MIRMTGIVSLKHEQFNLGRPCNVTAIKTFIKGVKFNLENINNPETTEKKILYIARDIEKSILESRYKDFLTTNDIEYNTLISAIVKETEYHNFTID